MIRKEAQSYQTNSIKIIKFTNQQVINDFDAVCQQIDRVLKSRTTH